MQNWETILQGEVDKQFEQMVTVRRHLHSHPELSGREYDTSLYLYRLFADDDFNVRIGPEGRGLIVDLDVSGESKCKRQLALRADLDALRIQDQKTVSYRSKTSGIMHACGHDVHTGAVLGTLRILRDLDRKQSLPWPVKVRGIFQPAEETCQGAKEMIEAGALEDVKGILGFHVDPTRAIGQIGLRDGVLTASADRMTVRIVGRGGHAARPHEASDPIAAGAQLISSLYTFVPRTTDSQDAVVLTIGQIDGADLSNAIPEWIELGGTLRTLDPTVRKTTIQHIRQMAEGIGQMSSTKIDVSFGLGSGSIYNDPHIMSFIRTAAKDVVGRGGIQEIDRPSMGSEDFAFFLDHVPGAMFRLGCCANNSESYDLHSPKFDVDERALRIGAHVMALSAILWSAPSD